MVRLGKTDLSKWVIALPLLATVFAPRSAVIPSPFLTFGAIGAAVGFGFLAITILRRGISKTVFHFWSLLFLTSVTASCSQVLNTSELVTSGISRIFRPFLYAVLIAYGYKVARWEKSDNVRDGLLWAVYLIVIGQSIVGFTQVLGMNTFELLYATDKASASKIRTVGTLSNPTLFGWVLAHSLSIIYILEKITRRKYSLIILCVIMIILSGSRTSLILIPIVILSDIAVSNLKKGDWAQVFISTIFVSAASAIFYIFFLDYFPYLSTINKILQEGSLSAVNSLRERFVNWETNAKKFLQSGWHIWALGLSHRPSTQVLDNSYLYVLFRTGVIGITIHISLIIKMLIELISHIESEVSQICLVYIISSLVVGFVADALGGWFFPIWPMYLLGIVIGLKESTK